MTRKPLSELLKPDPIFVSHFSLSLSLRASEGRKEGRRKLFGWTTVRVFIWFLSGKISDLAYQ